jgi:hypothetical protein
MMNRDIGLAVVALSITIAACSSGSAPVETSAVGASVADTIDRSIDELFEAGDYAGVVRAFAADESLGRSERSLYRAAIASAMPGHPGHGRARALGLLTRLLTEHPDSGYLVEARLVIALLEEEAALLRANGRLEQELEQLKAIDLGERP